MKKIDKIKDKIKDKVSKDKTKDINENDLIPESSSILERKDIFQRQDLDYTTNQILISFIKDNDIALKSDIENVRNFTSLKVLQFTCKAKELETSNNALKKYIKWYLRFRVSNKRLSRREILDALKYVKSNEQELDNRNPFTRNILK